MTKLSKDDVKTADESVLRDGTAISPDSIEELSDYIQALVERQHDYGTCVYAMTYAALAAFNYVAGKLGATGFQASCADMTFISKNRSLEHGCRLVNWHDLLYPQYRHKFRLSVPLDTWNSIRQAAKDLLTTNSGVETVREHWRSIVAGKMPFGLTIDDEHSR